MEAIQHRAPTANDADGLLEQWTAVQAGFHRLTLRLAEEVTRRTGLPSSSVQILLLLLHSPPCHSVTMTQLARHLEFSTAGITKVTDRLAQAGLIERSPCTTDRRVVRAKLTTDGLRAAQQAADIMVSALNREVIGKIGQEDFARLTNLVSALDASH